MKFRISSAGLSAAAVLLAGFLAGASPARAEVANLCPNSATFGGFGGTETPFSGTQDFVCGTNSGETIAIPVDTNYAKLQWNASNTANYPTIDLGELTGLSASVNFVSGQSSDSPYFLLAFQDPSASLGNGVVSTDQLLAIEFTSLGISGAGQTTMTLDPNSTPLVLYDNTQGFYIPGYGQSNPHTLNAILSSDPALVTDDVEGTWLAIGLAGGCSAPCGESLAVDTMTESYTPEPGTMGLMIAGLGAAYAAHRRRAAKRAPGV
ncbi:MAG TPA: PEP-CTERM sorting domain-containing protein [Bryobacteraceae bacterium]|nr:PEP-CTERM sorting domain-containing protein [Bryobacteraceae bacterium]